jgi:hypothetical protein
MQNMLDTLARFVDLDVPFLLDERSKRVATLKEMMTRADVSVSEKYRRIVEAYVVEMDGRTIEAYGRSSATAARGPCIPARRPDQPVPDPGWQETGYCAAEELTTTSTASGRHRGRCSARPEMHIPVPPRRKPSRDR